MIEPAGRRPEEAPDDLAAALDADPIARAGFDRFSYSHRKEFVDWIEGAKRPETRANRIVRAVEMIRAKSPLK